MPPYTDLLGSLEGAILDRLIGTVLMVAVLLAVRSLLMRVVSARVSDVNTRYRWRKGINYFVMASGVFTVGRIWSSGIAEFGTFLGLLTAGLAIALREPLTNIGGWLFLVWRRPFRVGDRIQLGELAGDVVDIRMFQFSLLEIRGSFEADQPTGRLAHIPNAMVFNTPQLNSSDAFPYIWTELAVTLTFESDWEKAKADFQRIANRHGCDPEALRHALHSRYAIGDVDGRSHVFTSVGADGVILTIRALCNVRAARVTEEQIWEDVLRSVASWEDVDFAYPTTRYYDNRREGKPGARAALLPIEGGDAPAPSPGPQDG